MRKGIFFSIIVAVLCVFSGRVFAGDVYGVTETVAPSENSVSGTFDGTYMEDPFSVSWKADRSSEAMMNVSLNQSQYSAGDTMRVTLTTTPGVGDNLLNVYVALIFPNNAAMFMTYAPALTASLSAIPARPLATVNSSTQEILDIVLPAGLSLGNWAWASVLAKPDLSWVSQISLAPFTFVSTHQGVSGTWIGTFHSSHGPSGTFTAQVVQQGSTLSGTISVPYLGLSAALTGTITGNSVNFGDVGNQIAFSATVSGNTITGTYSYPALGDSGTIVATKS